MLPAPDRFVFENRTLADWLLQLVDEDAAKRKVAAKVVTDRFFMPTELLPSTQDGVEAFLEEFRAEVRKVVNTPGFPTAEFVQNLLSLNLALKESWCAKVDEEHKRDKETDQAALAKLGEDPSKADQKRYVRRVWIHTLRECKRIREEEPHEVFVTGAASAWVIESLGEALLPAAVILREMLSSRHKASVASEAIARMGRKGLQFYEDLLAGLSRDEGNHNHYCAQALGGVLKAAPEKIPEILRLALQAGGASQMAALRALGACGRTATEALPELEARLREIFETSTDEKIWFGAITTLGKCGQTAETVTSLLACLDLRDPNRTGEIIVALGELGREPQRVVPRLAELLDSFEEYDPDWSYHGEHERVVQALSVFGAEAAPAIPALVRHIWTGPEKYWTEDKKLQERPEPDEAVIKFLGELGPAASSALPVLLDVRKEMKRRSELQKAPEIDQTESDALDSFVDVAIKRIQGHKGSL